MLLAILLRLTFSGGILSLIILLNMICPSQASPLPTSHEGHLDVEIKPTIETERRTITVSPKAAHFHQQLLAVKSSISNLEREREDRKKDQELKNKHFERTLPLDPPTKTRFNQYRDYRVQELVHHDSSATKRNQDSFIPQQSVKSPRVHYSGVLVYP
ncbi:hypothetical protein BJ684DRAFT_15597 [Piptocephalis cylindrospora]|uniref:Uncharacterized protein n=1 Tax=Piptocephalis cylindrospora TaxID=1907219 RepID=A0A4P9Y758_9FUNG|nr:hypothetical protein BJ684DRAFT_15597 [Piptocephalis cylindrospora]|eukprot:RKP14061.1 hypothetical protein BJ684DRAFT_15597 [Piptocephalis cylindrospora]